MGYPLVTIFLRKEYNFNILCLMFSSTSEIDMLNTELDFTKSKIKEALHDNKCAVCSCFNFNSYLSDKHSIIIKVYKASHMPSFFHREKSFNKCDLSNLVTKKVLKSMVLLMYYQASCFPFSK